MLAGRPPLSLAIVIDRSGSMNGPPIENAKAAALSVLRQLDNRDAFTVVTYSSGSEVVVPMQHASDASKAAARAAIETIDDDGGTCISCGLDTAAAELARSPLTGVSRILLISDGQANQGVVDRQELAGLAAGKAAHGASISTVGVGLDFDEDTMRLLAEVGRGNYYFVEDTVALSQMFARELGRLSQTIATEVQLTVTPAAGARVEEVYGYPLTRSGDRVTVPVADLRAGETRKVVLRLALDASGERQTVRGIAEVELGWRRVADGSRQVSAAAAEVDVTDDRAAIAASLDRPALQAVEQALSARALEQAAQAYDRDGLDAARQVLEQRTRTLRANQRHLDARTIEALEAASGEALDGFARSPEQARKATSVKAYELAR